MLHVPLCHWTIQLLDFVYTENQHNIFRFHCFRIVSKVGLIIQFCIALVFNAKSLNYFVAFVKFSVQHCLASTMPQCTCCTPNISCAIKYFVLYVFIHRFCASHFIQKLVFPMEYGKCAWIISAIQTRCHSIERVGNAYQPNKNAIVSRLSQAESDKSLNSIAQLKFMAVCCVHDWVCAKKRRGSWKRWMRK